MVTCDLKKLHVNVASLQGSVDLLLWNPPIFPLVYKIRQCVCKPGTAHFKTE